MECLPKNNLFNFKPDTLEMVRKNYQMDKPGAMKQAVDILEEWIKTQNHFTRKEFPRTYLERIIISSKGSVERAKTRLDKLFTLRTLTPILFKNFNVKTDFRNIQDIITYVILPEMTEDYDRVYICKLIGKSFKSDLFLEGFQFCLLLSEYARAHDYANAYHIVIDYIDVNVADMLANCNVQELRQALSAQIDGYGISIKGVHIITPSKLIDAIVSIAKQVVSPKIGQRIHCHKEIDTVFNYIPKHIFPKNYGGNAKSLEDLHADWMEELSGEEYTEYWKSMNAARTDESLRSKDDFNNQYMGMPGTFRTLHVD